MHRSPHADPALPFRFAVLSTIALLAAACGGGGGGGGSAAAQGRCTDAARKNWVFDVTRDWYLFTDLLPASVSTSDYATPEALLDALTATARAEGKDRGFSFLTTRQEDDSFFGEGQFVGFGFRTRIDDGTRLFLTEVFEGSPAAGGGLARGTEISAIDAGSGFRPVSEWLSEDPGLADAFGPAEQGVSRGLRLLENGGVREVTLTKAIVTIDPVADPGGTRTLPLSGTAGVGYLNLRTFISTAEPELRDAFGAFRSAGLTDFVIDLRYNGGGLVSTTELLGDLLGADRTVNDVFSRTHFNPARAVANDSTRRFQPSSSSVAPVRLAFLTTGGTASASELVINSMKPWVEVAIVGGNTFGKPVGQSAFDLSGCDDRLRLIAFRTDNALDEGSYFDGLAGSVMFACSATDDLVHEPGDTKESMTAAALTWLETGACGAVIPTGTAAFKPSAPREVRFPRPLRPTSAQANMPGVY
jgi:carboxyl-terminal processing protease